MQPVTPFPACREGRGRVKEDKKFQEKTRFCHSGPGLFPVTMQVKCIEGMTQSHTLTTNFQPMISINLLPFQFKKLGIQLTD